MFLPLLPLAHILERGTAFIPQINLWVFCLRFYKNGQRIGDPHSIFHKAHGDMLQLAGFIGVKERENPLHDIFYKKGRFPSKLA